MKTSFMQTCARRAIPVAATVAVAAGVGLTSAPSASAAAFSYCNNPMWWDGDCPALWEDRHNLRRNHVRTYSSTRTVAASALTDGGGQYGNWVYGTSNGMSYNDGACHSYSGGTTLRAWAWQGGAATNMYPRGAYGSSEPACNLSSRVAGPSAELAISELDVPDATKFDSPTGTGVLNDDGDGNVCLTIPDPVDGSGTSCAPRASVIKNGLSVAIVSKEGEALSVASIPPVGGRVEVLDATARTTRLTVGKSGVATGSGTIKSIRINQQDGTAGSSLTIAKPPTSPSAAF